MSCQKPGCERELGPRSRGGLCARCRDARRKFLHSRAGATPDEWLADARRNAGRLCSNTSCGRALTRRSRHDCCSRCWQRYSIYAWGRRQKGQPAPTAEQYFREVQNRRSPAASLDYAEQDTEALVERWRPLIVDAIRKLRHPAVTHYAFEDLFSFGLLGAVHAMTHAAQGISVSYVYACIRGSIQEALNRKLPLHLLRDWSAPGRALRFVPVRTDEEFEDLLAFHGAAHRETPEALCLRREREQAVQAALNALEPATRRLVELKVFEDCPHVRAAEEVGVGRARALALYREGLESLRQHLQQHAPDSRLTV